MALRSVIAPVVLALAGCADLPLAHKLEIAGESYPVQWTQALGSAQVLLILEPGYARRCSHLRSTARRLAEAGALVLCLDAPMAGGNPMLADAFAGWLAGGLRDPQGREVPRRVVVGGLSAGAAFALRLGARLNDLAPDRLSGALLLDPVATSSFGSDLPRVAFGRPVLALLAKAHACNANHSALPSLRAAGVDVVALGSGSTHLDAEGEDGDPLGRAICGTPEPAAVEALRASAAQWLRGVAERAPTSGGTDAGTPGSPAAPRPCPSRGCRLSH